MNNKSNLARSLILLVILFFSSSNGYSACKPISGHVGGNPFVYRNPNNYIANGTFGSGGAIPMIEAHFKPVVEHLIANGRGTIAQDISYTLREIPNHPRALNTASKFEYRQANDVVFRSKHRDKLVATAECFFKRAVKLYPKDSSVYHVYGIHLYRYAKYKQALVMYKHSLKLDSSSPVIHYNAGLAYLKVGDIVNAKKHAKIAKNKGYKLPGLQRLIGKYEAEKKKKSAAE